MNEKELNERIRNLRHKMLDGKISNVKLAEKLGVNRAYVSMVFNRRKGKKASTIEKFEKAVDELIKES